ncbi:TauD/TfdA family dioxygenase [Ramlibacter rhizophilus]|uniref:TauD/TfdA family dioxygenase n=1 Tax=Ramlibacter rhizophilus TaxID=1781167 RepID=A0A4Z0BCI2_9BURK|nr:TauD/TfdA family dioxygenase [Ramlibacter rhizophilus]TFY96965.1 TauD/TfdA family dioxygenase [Ramlibacter rhizophilus]
MAIAPVPFPNAWLSSQMHRERSRWTFPLDTDELAQVERALGHVRSRGASIPFGPEDFPLGSLADRLKAIRAEVEEGTGVALIRGLEVDRYGVQGARLVYWGLGAHLGTALAQNPRGALLVDVRDEGGDPYRDPTQRGYHTAQYLPFHNDQGDVVGLLCLRTAREGGLSCVCSSGAIHNEILASRPELVEVLYGDWYADVRGEEPPGRKPYYVEPRYALHEGRFYAQHGPTYIKSAQRFPEVPRLSREQLEALELVTRLAAEDRFRLDMDFQPGDVQFLNNHLVLHSRTAFVDHEEPERKRHLLRLWLSTPAYADVPPFFRARQEDMAYWLREPRP